MRTPYRIADVSATAGLSPRLATALSMIGDDCSVLADIGTDHGQLPIAAVKMNLVVRAIACDIAPGPLTQAVTSIFTARLNNRVITRLGDGFDPVEDGEADVVVIAGMGGMNIVDILEDGLAKAKKVKRLIVQPMHDVVKLRKELHRLGFFIADERLAREGVRFYVLIMATPASHAPVPWPEKDYYLGRHLVDSPDWKEYVKVEIVRLEGYIASGASGEKRDEYEQRLIWLKEALRG